MSDTSHKFRISNMLYCSINKFNIDLINKYSLYYKKIEQKISNRFPNNKNNNFEIISIHEASDGNCFSEEGVFINTNTIDFWDKDRFQYRAKLKHPEIGEFFITF